MLYDLFSPQVYVVSEKTYNEYQQKKIEAQVAEIDRSIKYCEDRIAYLKERREAVMAQ